MVVEMRLFEVLGKITVDLLIGQVNVPVSFASRGKRSQELAELFLGLLGFFLPFGPAGRVAR